MLQMAQIILFIASVDVDSLHIAANIQVQCSRFLHVSVHGEDAAGGDNAFLSHK